MKILLCDDDEIFLTELKEHVCAYMEKRLIKYEIVAVTDPEDIFLSSDAYDLIFMDIELGSLNGLEIAKTLRKRNGKAIIFFITSFNGYQDEAMDLRAFRFFEKPFDAQRLDSSLDKAMEYLDEIYVDTFLVSGDEQKKISVDDIIYIRRENRKVILTSADGEYITKESFDDWCEKLPNLFFYQIHKSFLVNLHYVDIYKYNAVYLNDGTRLPIAPRKQSAFHKYWFDYLRRR